MSYTQVQPRIKTPLYPVGQTSTFKVFNDSSELWRYLLLSLYSRRGQDGFFADLKTFRLKEEPRRRAGQICHVEACRKI